MGQSVNIKMMNMIEDFYNLEETHGNDDYEEMDYFAEDQDTGEIDYFAEDQDTGPSQDNSTMSMKSIKFTSQEETNSKIECKCKETTTITK